MMQKLDEELRLFHPIFFTDRMESLFLDMFSDNAIVKEHIMTKDKVTYYLNYEIASVFRDVMLLTCMKQ